MPLYFTASFFLISMFSHWDRYWDYYCYYYCYCYWLFNILILSLISTVQECCLPRNQLLLWCHTRSRGPEQVVSVPSLHHTVLPLHPPPPQRDQIRAFKPVLKKRLHVTRYTSLVRQELCEFWGKSASTYEAVFLALIFPITLTASCVLKLVLSRWRWCRGFPKWLSCRFQSQFTVVPVRSNVNVVGFLLQGLDRRFVRRMRTIAKPL